MTSLLEWYKGVPPVTRLLFTGALALSVLTKFGWANPLSFIWSWDLVLHQFHPSHLLSICFIGPLSMSVVFDLAFLVRYGQEVERSIMSDAAQYLYVCLLAFAAFLGLSFILPLYLPAMCLIFAILQIWSRQMGTVTVNFMFIQMPAAYFALALGLLSALQGDLQHPLVGIAVGHLMYLRLDRLRAPAWAYWLASFLPEAQDASSFAAGGVYRRPHTAPGQPRATAHPGSGPVRVPPPTEPSSSVPPYFRAFRGSGRLLGSQ